MIDIIFGTRPEAIKMAMLIKQVQQLDVPHRIVSTGQHKEMLHQVLDWFDIVPHYDLGIMSANQSLALLSARAIERLQAFYDEHGKPSIVCVQGDTTTAFIAGLVAFYNKVKVAHIEAGLRTNNKWSPFPEELNRKLLTSLADYHFAPTALAEQQLLSEGVAQQQVHNTGNTVIDALLYSKAKLDTSNYHPAILESIFTERYRNNKVVLVTGHRRENFGDGFKNICKAIRNLSLHHPEVFFVYPVHLNPNVKEVVHELLSGISNVLLIEPLGYADFIALMNRSFFILTDSGGVQEEAPSLKKPVLVMRENTERMEGVTAGVVKLIGINEENIFKEANKLLTEQDYYESFQKNANPYGNGTASNKIIEVLKNYV